MTAEQTPRPQGTLAFEPVASERLPLSLKRFLEIATGAAAALAELHGKGKMHAHVTSEDILVDAATGAVRLSDAQASTRSSAARPSGAIGGNPVYVSPEQTGRVGRPVDARSDLYSLGICFYEWLTGRPPFAASDPLELVHCHLARVPSPPTDLRPELPRVLSDLVAKLLSKLPEQRYQTARGLERDLGHALASLRATGAVASFPLAEGERDGRLRTPDKLYGRDADIAAMRAAFARTLASGRPELLLVSGYSGIGKTSLVNRLRPAIAMAAGAFVAGKFDQFIRGIPYGAIRQVLSGLVQQVLVGSDAAVHVLRERILTAVGQSGRLVIDLAPSLELVIGAQPEVPPLPPSEAQHRLRQVLRRFIGVFAHPAHPLVLFLDDLQWADLASLEVLRDLLTQDDVRHLLLIGAYRDNEVTAAHPLMLIVDGLVAAGLQGTRIVLAPLATEHVTELLGDALGAEPDRAEPLARLLRELTLGNPFFVNQLLVSLHEEGLLSFSADEGRFRWDLAKIRGKGVTDNVIDLMRSKIQRLAPATQEALTIMACAGNASDGPSLARIRERPEEQVHVELAEATREGLVLKEGTAYTFVHDGVQQAAYSLLGEADRSATHLRIGRLLLSSALPEAHEERVFDIVSQLNAGIALITDPGERERVAALNLVAGKKAKASAAYKEASTYLAAGAALLPEDAFAANYPLAYGLRVEEAECAFLQADFERAQALVQIVLEHARSRSDKAAAYRVRCSVHETKGEMALAVESAVESLRLFDIHMPAHPSTAEVERAYQELSAILGDRPIEDLIRIPETRDPDVDAAMQTLSGLYAIGFFTDTNLLYMHAIQMVRLTLERGTTAASAHGYAWFGFTLTAGFGESRKGYLFAKLARALAVERGFASHKARALLVLEILTFWNAPIDEMLAHVDEGFLAALEIGDLPLAAYYCNHLITDMLTRGDPLDRVHQAIERRIDFVRRSKFTDIEYVILAQERFVRAMRGETNSLGSFGDAAFSEEDFEARARASAMQTMVCWYFVMKLQTRFMAGDYEEALRAAAEAEPRLWASLAHVQYRDYHFYHALTLAALHDGRDPEERPRLLATLRAHREKFTRWAELYPANFRDQEALLLAEIARIEGREREAELRYEEAISAARASGFLHHEGIAHERFAAFFRARGMSAAADGCLAGARRCYVAWGATGKVRQIDRADARRGSASSRAQDLSLAAVDLDARSLIKASQAISAEIILDRLFTMLVRIIIENAGAQAGLLVRPSGGEMRVVARANAEGASAISAGSDASAGSAADASAGSAGSDASAGSAGDASAVSAVSDAALPLSLLAYVERTRERVILGDATRDHLFSADPYLASRRPRSVLCMPLMRREHVLGVLYLEHGLIADLFNEERLAALDLLAAQASISLENALLYDELEQRVRDRTRELEAAQAMLIDAAHRGGMAEIASSVLHNVGNALTALNSGAFLLAERVEKMPIDQVKKSAALLTENAGKLGDFLERDERGRVLPAYLDKLGERLQVERSSALTDLRGLQASIDRIKGIVAAQQAYAHGPRFVSGARVEEIVEDAVKMQVSALESHSVIIEREIADLPPLRIEKHKLTQIVLNLLSNAKHALLAGSAHPKRLSIRAAESAPGWLTLTVVDNGVGIPAENLSKLFHQGFTTRPGSLGFGLHWSANAAREMGGSVEVHSEGPGKGATVILRVPLVGPEGPRPAAATSSTSAPSAPSAPRERAS